MAFQPTVIPRSILEFYFVLARFSEEKDNVKRNYYYD